MAFGEYKGRCLGRLMHFLYEIDTNSDLAIFSSKDKTPMITLHGKPYADYVWDGDTDIPTFTFLGRFAHFNQTQAMSKRHWLKNNGYNVKEYLAKYCPNLPRPQGFESYNWTPESCQLLDMDFVTKEAEEVMRKELHAKAGLQS